jgi:hypothetical protein
MNGIALLLLTATLGVEYDWRTLEDGQIEYVLIVEPDFIPSLAEGSEIRSSVPPELESVQRLCIRIAQPANSPANSAAAPRSVPATSFRNSRIGLRATDPPTIFWKAKGQPEESTNVRYGWQPTKDGLQEYFVQLDPKFLRTLAPGDEIYTTLSAEAGRVDTFVVFSNAKQLPKVPGKPVGPPAGPTTGNSFTGVNPPPSPGPAFSPLPSAPLAANNSPPLFGPLSTAPPLASAPNHSSTLDRPFTAPGGAFAGVNDNNPRGNLAAGYDQAAPAPTYGSNNATAPPRPNYSAPNSAPPVPNANGYTAEGFRNNEGFRGTEGYRGNDLRNNDPRDQFAQQPNPYLTQTPANPRNDLFPAEGDRFANHSPNLNPNAPGVRNTAAPLTGSSLPATGNNQPGSAPYRPGVGYPQDTALQPAPYDNRPPSGSQPAVDYRPQVPDNQLASRDLNTLRPGTRNDLPPNPLGATAEAERPWWTLVFMSFFLFVSIGANFYLGWTAAEFYSRYKLAVERLRTSSRA